MKVSAFAGRNCDPVLDFPGDTKPIAYRAVDLRDGRHGVFLIHHETREWWRLIAVFASEARAESYAGIENDCSEWPADVEKPMSHVVQAWAPAPETLPPEPESGLTNIAQRQQRNREDVLRALTEIGRPATWGEIRDSCEVCPEGSVYRVLKTLRAAGLVRYDGERWEAAAADAGSAPHDDGPLPTADELAAVLSAPTSVSSESPADEPAAEAVTPAQAWRFMTDAGFSVRRNAAGDFVIDERACPPDAFLADVNSVRARGGLPPWRWAAE